MKNNLEMARRLKKIKQFYEPNKKDILYFQSSTISSKFIILLEYCLRLLPVINFLI